MTKQKKMGRLLDEDDVVDWLLKITEMYDGTGHFVDENVVKKNIESQIAKIPSAQTEWNNHTVACLLAELFDDTCACNYNGIDEWLPEKCEVIDSCPNPVGVACWEQYLKHRAERREE